MSQIVVSALIYTDGAASGNPGPGGWGALFWNQKSNEVSELGGGVPQTTNNRMEMRAALEGLRFAKGQNVTHLEVRTDSKYLINGVMQWIHGWKKNQWKTRDGAPVKNQDLWELIDEMNQKIKVMWTYVPGHLGVPGNERADRIAVAFSKDENCSLFHGLYSDYSVDLEKVDPPKKIKPYYLSYIEGQLQKHTTWSECETRVRGRRGARFKKISNSDEEQEILKKWGLSSQ